jgi:hypothetical protein
MPKGVWKRRRKSIGDRLADRSVVSTTKGWTKPETGVLTACIEWTGKKLSKSGYGQITMCCDGEQYTCSTHRVSWGLHKGAIPDESAMRPAPLRQPSMLEPRASMAGYERAE